MIKLVWTAFSILALGASARAQCLDWSEPEPPAGLIDTVAGSGSVHAFAVHDDGSGPALYVAGQFAGMGAALSTNVARWNGSTFEPLAGLPRNCRKKNNPNQIYVLLHLCGQKG